MDLRILQLADLEAVKAFGERRLKSQISDAFDFEMQSWTARWREESLRHYLPLGWSFGAFDSNGDLQGVALAQPFIFFRGLTQTLWVEYFDFQVEEAGSALLETVYRWGRDKHIQSVIVEDGARADQLARAFSGKLNAAGWYEIPTTRMKT